MKTDVSAENKGIEGSGPARTLLKKILIIGSLFLFAIAAGATGGYVLTADIPEVTNLENWKPPVVTVIYAADGTPARQFGGEKRILVAFDEIPTHFLQAVIATEDSRFQTHFGVDPLGTARALLKDLIHLRYKEGGSTLTQQLAKMLFLKPEKTFRRKIQEAVLAIQIEKTYTKNEILVFYCNQIYLAHGRYGVETASRFYFGKPAREMTLAESALLAGMIQRPEGYSPIRKPDKALARRNYVLDRLAAERYITPEQAEEAKQETIESVEPRDEDHLAPYFVEEVRRYLDKEYGEITLYQEGLEVYTTLDPEMQRAANEAVSHGLRAVDKRQGFRDIETNILKDSNVTLDEYRHPDWARDPRVGDLRHGLVTLVERNRAEIRIGDFVGELTKEGIGWTRASSVASILEVGDVALFLVDEIDRDQKRLKLTLDQEPNVEGALVALEPATGEVKALVGGYDFSRSEFDRAIQSYRQPGSAFKPFVYLAALDSGYTLGDTLFDEPTVFLDRQTNVEYQPENYTRRYYGTMTLRTALEESRNIVSVKLLNQIGYNKVIDFATRMGLTSRLSPYPSLALGTSEVSLWDMVSAYSVLPNQGIRVEPHLIRKIVDREGALREETRPAVTEVLRPDIAYLMTYALQGVTETGTGAAARVLERPVGGKTGTTDDLADAWFVGFTPSLAVGVWVGFDQKQSLGVNETGAHVALPIWIQFLQQALRDQPPEKFPRPANVTFVPVDRRTGLKAGMNTHCRPIILEAFLRGTAPTAQCSEAHHFRLSLPYYLQRYTLNRRQELRIDGDGLLQLMQQGLGTLSLSDDLSEIILKEEGQERRIPIDISRRDRRRLQDQLRAGMPLAPPPPPAPDQESQAQRRTGRDGRAATLVLIKHD